MARQAMAEAQKECPEIVDSLRQQIAVRATMAELAPNAIRPALGGPFRREARFELMLARAYELDELNLSACVAWEDFRAAAVRERWFPAKGPEAAVVYLHMDQTQRAHLDVPHLPPEWLFEQACSMDPAAELFQAGMDRARRNQGPTAAERVAEVWSAALPNDRRPLLGMVESAEGRDAFKKALRYLAQAEALDGLNPEVRRARMRLAGELGFHIQVPQDWQGMLSQELRQGSAAPASVLKRVAEAALRQEWPELAFEVSVAGMARGPETEADFLLIRAQALPQWEQERRKECLAAVVELARRRRDSALAGPPGAAPGFLDPPSDRAPGGAAAGDPGRPGGGLRVDRR